MSFPPFPWYSRRGGLGKGSEFHFNIFLIMAQRKRKTRTIPQLREQDRAGEIASFDPRCQMVCVPDATEGDAVSELFVEYRDRHYQMGLFFLLLFSACTFFCAMFLREYLVVTPSWKILAVTPLFAVWAFFGWMFFRSVFHKETLHVNSDGINYRFTAIFPVVRRFVAWSDLVAVHPGRRVWAFTGANMWSEHWAMEIETTKDSCLLLNGLGENETAQIRQLITRIAKRQNTYTEAHLDRELRLRGKFRLIENQQFVEVSGQIESEGVKKWFLFLPLILFGIGFVYSLVGFVYSIAILYAFTILFYLVTSTVLGALFIAVLLGLIHCFFGNEMLRLDADGVTHIFVNPVYRREKRTPHCELASIKSIKVYGTASSVGLEIHTNGKNIRCFQQQYGGTVYNDIATLFQKRLKELKRVTPQIQGEKTNQINPRDNRWSIVESDHTVVFTRKGVAHWQLIFAGLFTNIAWNGTVLIFLFFALGWGPENIRFSIGANIGTPAPNVHRLVRENNPPNQGTPITVKIFLFLFITPFAILGLGLFGGLLRKLLELLSREKLTFSTDRIEYRKNWFGLGYVLRWNRQEIRSVRIVLQRQTKWDRYFYPVFGKKNELEYSDRFALLFINNDDTKKELPNNLYRGEAKWIQSFFNG